MNIKLTLQEARHLLVYNTGFLSCPHPDHNSYPNGDCKWYAEAKRKIELAIENTVTNGEQQS